MSKYYKIDGLEVEYPSMYEVKKYLSAMPVVRKARMVGRKVRGFEDEVVVSEMEITGIKPSGKIGYSRIKKV